MGTPDFSVPSLKALVEAGYEIPLVVTQPDRPSGRGQQLQSPPVKLKAQEYGLKVIQPENLKSEERQSEILNTPCDFLVVVAFGQILPSTVLNHPSTAPLNVHASLLPAYRGAAPIARSILEGESKTGITIQWMIEALDQGDILYQIPCDIKDDDTSATLHDKLKTIGAQALIECLQLFHSQKVVRRSQDARVGSYAPKLKKAESDIRFNQSAYDVHRTIMGLNPWPVAQCQLAGKNLRLFKSQFLPRHSDAPPGTIIDLTDGQIVVACKQGCVALLEVQLENRKRMSVEEFLRGHPLPQGLILGASQ